jgi:hypothetical protein
MQSKLLTGSGVGCSDGETDKGFLLGECNPTTKKKIDCPPEDAI